VKGKIVDLEAHFCNEVLTCASRLQPADMDGNGTTETSQLDTTQVYTEKFGIAHLHQKSSSCSGSITV